MASLPFRGSLNDPICRGWSGIKRWSLRASGLEIVYRFTTLQTKGSVLMDQPLTSKTKMGFIYLFIYW